MIFSDHLALDAGGELYAYDPGAGTFHRLGPVEDADVPDALEDERDELLDLYRDAVPLDDYRAEVVSTYYAGLF